MASIYKQIDIDAPAAQVWNAVRDWGAPHLRLAPGFVTACEIEPGARTVTFGNGTKVRELILGMDDSARRLAYSAVGGRAAHHNSSIQVFDAAPGQCHLIWITDLLPDALLVPINAMVEEGAAVIKKTLES